MVDWFSPNPCSSCSLSVVIVHYGLDINRDDSGYCGWLAIPGYSSSSNHLVNQPKSKKLGKKNIRGIWHCLPFTNPVENRNQPLFALYPNLQYLRVHYISNFHNLEWHSGFTMANAMQLLNILISDIKC